jgi:hypothetical protein
MTLLDNVQIKHIRSSMKVTPIEGKIKEARVSGMAKKNKEKVYIPLDRRSWRFLTNPK